MLEAGTEDSEDWQESCRVAQRVSPRWSMMSSVFASFESARSFDLQPHVDM